MTASINTDRLPRGDRSWRTFIEGLSEVDDTAESFWLEMKSELDLSKAGGAKVAKFVLGAANRNPELASRALEGYAIMVLGVSKDGARGIPPVEDMEIEKRILPFLGANGPVWDTVRVPMPGGGVVLVIVVDPPAPGLPMYVCRKDGDGVADGDVYIRARGQTRHVKSDEMDQLRARERARTPNVDLDVSVVGAVRAYTCDPDVLNEYTEKVRVRLLAGLPAPKRSLGVAGDVIVGTGLAAILESIGDASAFGSVTAAWTVPEDRTVDAFRVEVDTWVEVCRRSLGGLLDGLIATVVPPSTFVIRNASDQYLSAVEVNLHLEGAVETVDALPGKFDPRHHLPAEPRSWGPRQRDLGLSGLGSLYTPGLSDLRVPGRPASSFTNGGSVDADFELPELRSRATREFGDDVVLIVRDPSMTAVKGTWSATAQDVHAVITGTCEVSVNAPLDVTARLKSLLAAVAEPDQS